MKKESKKRKKNYIKNVFSIYSVWEIIQITSVMIISIGLIDWYDIPSTRIHFNNFTIGIVILFGIFIVTTIKRLYLQEILKIVAINAIELWVCVGIIFSVGYFVFVTILNMLEIYKIYILCFMFFLSVMIFFVRKWRYEKADTKADEYKGNTIDLKELYEGKISSLDEILLLDESEVDYDLMERHSIINHLYNTLCNCKPQKRFVISLEGKWGVGKSTILRNVKRMIQEQQKDIVVIDDFDPWTYGTEESIVENFFCCLLNNNDLKINTLEMRNSVSVLSKAVIASTEKSDWFERTFLKEKTVEESKKQINEYLRLCGKKIVIFIDNLDRINDEKILFLFKLIGNVLEFDRMIFVVSFDPEVVCNILETQSNIGYNYLEKIIQMQIRVPENDKDVLANVVQVCTMNLLNRYGLDQEKIADYKAFVEDICDSIKDIREYKRVVNSIIVKVVSNTSYLSRRDLLTIEYIKMKNFTLYQTIYKNGRYFISEGKMYNVETYLTTFQKEQHEKEAKRFLEELFDKKENRRYQKMLARVFPYINRFCDKSGYTGVKTLTSEQIEKSRGIASAKYFPLYFCDTENELSILGGSVEKYIREINSNEEDVEKGIKNILNGLGSKAHREILEVLQLYIPEIDKKKLYELSITLIDCYWSIDNTSMFFMLNARRRCTVLIWEILRLVEEKEFQLILQYLSKAYDKIEMLSEVSYWFERNVEDKKRHEELKELIDKLVNDIITNKINLYDNQ